jgi:hypothetical protein
MRRAVNSASPLRGGQRDERSDVEWVGVSAAVIGAAMPVPPPAQHRFARFAGLPARGRRGHRVGLGGLS